MGLDWCVRDKVNAGMDASVKFAEAHLKKVNSEITEEWAKYADKALQENPEVSTHIFPNPVDDAFRKTDIFKELDKKRSHWESVREPNVTSPMETLGAPRVGYDDIATEYAKKQYGESEKLRELFPTIEQFLEDRKGFYVPQLVSSDGIATVTGIFTGAESFRGKEIANMACLHEMGFDEDCYADRNADELYELGVSLDKAADHYEANCEQVTAEIKEELKIIRDAANWCRFWGERGHGMYTWY